MGKSKTGAGSSGLCKDSRMPQSRLPSLSEVHLEKQCSDILELDGWRPLKTDPVSNRAWGKGFGELGMADRLYLRYQYEGSGNGPARAGAQVMWIEWKRLRGRRSATKTAPHQETWIAAERARGALVVVAGQDFAATFEAFCAWYRGSGLLRRAWLC